jgi:hypothetical protein
MENRAKLPATGRQGPAPPEDRQPPIEGQGHGPQELSEGYAQWLDGWMFDDEDEQQEAKA